MPQFICLMTPIKPRDSAPARSPKDLGAIYGRHGTYLTTKAEEGVITYAGYTNGKEPGKLSLVVLHAETIYHECRSNGC